MIRRTEALRAKRRASLIVDLGRPSSEIYWGAREEMGVEASVPY